MEGQEATRGPESKSSLKMKAAKDAGEEYCDPDRKDNILRRNNTRSALGNSTSKYPIVALNKSSEMLKIRAGGSWLEYFVEVSVLQWSVLASSNPKFVGKADLVGRLPTWIRLMVCVSAQHPWSGMCQESTGRMASSFSS